MISKIGIYSGSFDPVHNGHLAFAEAAMRECNLDKVYFLAEPRPRRKQGVRALEHREAMLRIAIADNPKLGIIHIGQSNFTVENTLPKLKARFVGAKMYFLMGEDIFSHLSTWPHVKDLLRASNFIVGIRQGDEKHMKEVLAILSKTRGIKFETSFITTSAQDITSTAIRMAYKRGKRPVGLQESVGAYIEANGLYTNRE